MTTTVYDKAAWHIDAGEQKEQVLAHFKFIMEWSLKNKLLTDEGLEIVEFGVDDSISLHSRMFNERGNLFMKKFYDSFINVVEDNGNRMLEKLNYLS